MYLQLFLVVLLTIILTIIPGCTGNGETIPDQTTEPSSTYTSISGKIGGINPSSPTSLADLLGAAQDIDKAEGTLSKTEAEKLNGELKNKFNAWTKETVDGIDPTKPESIKDFFDLQAVQGTSEYEEYTDPQTKQYKEEQMGKKFNEWVRNRVDEINPTNPNDLKYFFWLQTIQQTEKYDEFATPETHNYKESQLRQKFNEWVENILTDLTPMILIS